MVAKVVLKTPKVLFVGSYAKVPVAVGPGIKFDSLDFAVPAGPKGGIVSISRDKGFDMKRPDVMLCAGYRPGKYVLQALKKGTKIVVAEAKFEVTSLWKEESAGPSSWFMGINKGYAAGTAWGGGPAGPQNINVSPATGTRRIAILLVDTSTQRFTADEPTRQGHRDRWMNELVNGVTQGGVTRSARLFYREVSYNNFDLSAQVFGPVQLPGTWDDYFNADGTPKGGYFQACVTAGDGDIDFNNFDTLLCVSQQVDGPPAKSAWPYASIGNWGPYTTAEGNKNLGMISMPNQWGVVGDREIYETFSHELGHNLGLGDQYTPTVAGRNVGGWDMMHNDNVFPHFSVAHRMILGWVPAGWIQTFNFASMGAPVDQTVTLHPIELGAPPGGRSSAIEIRLADGWNYYFEYRIGQAAQIGDRSVPTDSRVLGTDVVSPPWAAPIARPAVLLLNNDADGDGSVLGNGQDYEETDATDPVYPTDFKADVNNVDGAKAEVHVSYGVNSKPDPSIRPWPASPDRQWQSPDIEVRNARNAADAAWFNVPWVGHDNTVVARVKNNGTLDAPGVRVNFYVKNFNVGGTPETFLGTDVRDIPAGATVEFTTSWTPPSEGHFCMVVRIPLYSLPGPVPVVEMTELNNVAQSNYSRFISATASPPSREGTFVEVGNPYAKQTRVFITSGQNNPLYRTYIEHTWLLLNPGETRKVRVMFEYAPDALQIKDKSKTAATAAYKPEEMKKYARVPNNVGIVAFIEDPKDKPRHALQLLGGMQSQVVTGRATKFQEFAAGDRGVSGLIVAVDDGRPVLGGKAILTFSYGRDKQQKKFCQTLSVYNGRFSSGMKSKWDSIEAYYVPSPGYADCTIKGSGEKSPRTKTPGTNIEIFSPKTPIGRALRYGRGR